MTRHTEQARALFLTALMVISAVGMSVAFAGTAAASGHNVSSSGDIELASDIPGPIEYRGENQYQVVVAFDRNITDVGNFSFNVSGTNPQGNTVFNVTQPGNGAIHTNGTAADGTPLVNSVVQINVGPADDNRNNIVTDGEVTVSYTGANNFTKTLDVIATSAQIDAGVQAQDRSNVVYEGERVAVYNLTDPHASYEVFQGGSFQFSGESGDNTTVAFENTGTDDFQAGNDYRFDVLNTTVTDRQVYNTTVLDVRDLGLDITINRGGQTTTYPQDQPPTLFVNGTVESNVAARNVQLELFNHSSSASTQTINLRGGGADREADFSFTATPGGGMANYSVTATDLETGIEDSTDGFAVNPVQGNPTFTQNLYEEVRGNNASFTIDMGGLVEANVSLGDTPFQDDADANYGVTFRVSDDNGDGQVTVVLDTYNEGARYNDPATVSPGLQDGTTYIRTANSNDAIDTVYSSSYDEPGTQLDTGTYSLGVYVPGAGGVGEQTGVSVLQVTPIDLSGSISWVAPANAANDSSSILNSVTRGSSSAIGDNFVVQINQSGLYSVLNSNYDLENDRGASPIDIDIEQTNADEMNTNPNDIPVRVNGTIVDAANERIYVIVDTEFAPNVRPGQDYEATFTIQSTPATNMDSQSVSTNFSIQERVVRWGSTTNATGDVNVDAEQTTLTGTSTVAPGTTFNIRANSGRDDVPFLFTSPTVEVQDDGTFSTTFDFGTAEIEDGLETGTVPFSLRLRENSAPSNLDSQYALSGPRNVDGFVLQPPTAAVSLSSQVVSGVPSEIVVDEVTLSRGGFVVIHTTPVVPEGGTAADSVIGSSKKLGPGTHEDVRIVLDEDISADQTLVAMAHRDTNDNNAYDFPAADGPYVSNGSAVVAPADVTFQDPMQSPRVVTVTVTQESPTPRVVTRTVVQDSPTPREVTREVTRTVVQTREVTRTVVQTREVTVTITQTPSTPGMGIAVAVIALLAAALLAVRRRSQ